MTQLHKCFCPSFDFLLWSKIFAQLPLQDFREQRSILSLSCMDHLHRIISCGLFLLKSKPLVINGLCKGTPFCTSTCPQKHPHASWTEKGLPGPGGSSQRGQRSVLWSARITQCSMALLRQHCTLYLFCGGAEGGSINTALVSSEGISQQDSPAIAGTLLHLHPCPAPWRSQTFSLVLSQEGTEAKVQFR